MIFRDQTDAGQQLARALEAGDLVVALPRGGVVVGYEIAQRLALPLEVVCPRKIGAPGNPEQAIGAVTESGEIALNPGHTFDEETARIAEQERLEAKRRGQLYRAGRTPHSLEGRSLILVDDGIATGSTMSAAIKSVRQQGAKSITVAIPVAPPSTVSALREEVDEIVALLQPEPFYAVGQFYRHFDQTSDQEVIALLERSTHGRKEN